MLTLISGVSPTLQVARSSSSSENTHIHFLFSGSEKRGPPVIR